MNTKIKIITIPTMLIFFLIISACNSSVDNTPSSAQGTSTSTEVETEQVVNAQTDPSTPEITPSAILALSTPTPTIDPTRQSKQATAVMSERLTATAWQTQNDNIATKVAQFPPVDCEGRENMSILSPDEKWIVVSCGNRYNQKLILLNKDGNKWILNSEDFKPLSMQGQGVPGSLDTMFWDPEGIYLYFTTSIGWSGGGTECFRGFGTNGLFRLDLKNGDTTTLINPPEYFPGDEIKFAPTSRRYATDINGVTITDLKTGEVVQLDAENVMDLSWSPDGTNLAFSTSKCDSEGVLVSSSIYVWSAITRETHTLLTINKKLLFPDSWLDNNTLKIKGEDFINSEYHITVFEYDVENSLILFEGTATPRP